MEQDPASGHLLLWCIMCPKELIQEETFNSDEKKTILLMINKRGEKYHSSQAILLLIICNCWPGINIQYQGVLDILLSQFSEKLNEVRSPNHLGK